MPSCLSTFLCRLAWFVQASDLTPESFADVFRKFRDFLAGAAPERFHSATQYSKVMDRTKILPLQMSGDLLEEARSKLQGLVPFGTSQTVDFAYEVGQAILVIPMHADLARSAEPDRSQEIEKALDRLVAVWGPDRRAMNGTAISDAIQHMDAEGAKGWLLKRLDDSIEPARELGRIVVSKGR